MVMRQLKKELWPYCVCLTYNGRDQLERNTQIEEWLCENYGAIRERWNVLYRMPIGYKYEYYFRNQRDANWFALRWA